MIRLYIRDGDVFSVLVTNPRFNQLGKWQTGTKYLTEAGDIPKNKVLKWEKLEEWQKGGVIEANGENQDSQP